MGDKENHGSGRGQGRDIGSEKSKADFLKVTGRARYCRDLFPGDIQTPRSKPARPLFSTPVSDDLRRSKLRLVTSEAAPPQDIDIGDLPRKFLPIGIVGSPVAGGLVQPIDFAAISERHSVTCLTATDIPGENNVSGGVSTQFLANGEARYLGQPIAIVIGRERDSLGAALDEFSNALQVKAEEHTPEFPNDFLNSGVEPILKREVRIGSERIQRSGSVSVEARHYFPSVDPMTLESEGGYAWRRGDELHVRCSGSNGDLYRAWIGKLLNVSVEKIIWHSVLQGGNYGSREYTIFPLIVAMAAWLTGEPVYWFADFQAKQLLTKSGFGVFTDLKLSWIPNGGHAALEGRILIDLGSHFEQESVMADRIIQSIQSVYDLHSVHVDIEGYMTHSGPRGILKGSGFTAVTSSIEALVNSLALRLNEDPIEFREDLIREGEKIGIEVVRRMKKAQAGGLGPSVCKAHSETSLAKTAYREAVGIAIHNQLIPIERSRTPTKVELVFEKHGSFLIRLFGDPLTEGQKQALRRIPEEVLRLPIDLIRVESELGIHRSSGSEFRKNLYLSGNAVYKASKEMHRKLLELGSLALSIPEHELVIGDGYVVRQNGTDRLSIKELAFRYGDFKIETSFQSDRTGLSRFTGALAKVRINQLTGEVSVQDLTLFIDAGRVLEWDLFEAQLQGAVSWAMGVLFRRRQKGDYLEAPSVYDVPESVRFTVVSDSGEKNLPDDLFVIKGTGEGPQAAAVAAVLNAVETAVEHPVTAVPLDLIREGFQLGPKGWE